MHVLDPNKRYEMPASFGPTELDHIRYGDVTTLAIPFITDGIAMARLLPPGLEPAETPVVTVNRHRIADVSFLAGREYQIVSVTFSCLHRREDDTKIQGGYGIVLWEDDVYSCIVGREPFGAAKHYADIPAVDYDGDTWKFTCSEYGQSLISGELRGMKELSSQEVAEQHGQAGRDPVNFRYKHIPRASGGCDVSYLMRGNNFRATIDAAWEGSGSHTIHATAFEDAPVSHRVLEGLRSLPVLEYRAARASHGTIDIEQGTGAILSGPQTEPRLS